MAIETREKTINGANYAVTQFPAFEGAKVKIKLVKLLGPSLGQMASGVKDGKVLDATIGASQVGSAMDRLAAALDEDDFANFILRLLACTRKEGHEINRAYFDLEFAGDFLTMYKVIGFVLEVNYGSFFVEGAIGNLLAQMVAPPSSMK